VRNKNIKRLQILPKGDAEYFEYRLVYEDEKEPIEARMTQPPFECPDCDFVTESKSGFTQHYKRNHSGIPPTRAKIRCEFCGEYFGVPPSKKLQRTFCSMDCKSKWRSKNMVGDEHPSWKGDELERECSFCGELYRTSNKDSSFCSDECKYAWMSKKYVGEKNSNWSGGKVSKECPNCGDTFKVYPSLNHLVCCSNKCRSEYYCGKNHPCWVEEYDGYYGANWEEQRKKALQRDNYTCQNCGVQFNPEESLENKLHVHHIKPLTEFEKDEIEKEANRLENLISLCSSCHPKIESGNDE